MPTIRVRAPVAMRIARMDRQKFNEAVADGYYGCAPSADRGSARVFDEDDLIALFYFARLTDMGIAPRVAGYLACEVRVKLHQQPDDQIGSMAEPRISHVRSSSGMGHTINGYDPDHLAKKTHFPALGIVAFSIEFNVAQIRSLIRAEIEEERSILGGDDTE